MTTSSSRNAADEHFPGEPAPDRVEALARWLHEHDSEGAFTWESTADEWREQARELLAFLESLS